jgi:hypothetical protein
MLISVIIRIVMRLLRSGQDPAPGCDGNAAGRRRAESPSARFAFLLRVSPQDYFALRRRQPKPSERVRVAVKVSNSTGAGYGPEPDHAGVW